MAERALLVQMAPEVLSKLGGLGESPAKGVDIVLPMLLRSFDEAIPRLSGEFKRRTSRIGGLKGPEQERAA